MPLRNTKNEYGSVARFFHWTIALLVILMIIMGFMMVGSSGTLKGLLYGTHKSIGLTILFLLVLRLLWRFVSVRPMYPAGTPVWQAKAAGWSHTLLYTFLFIQTLTGWYYSTTAGHPPNFWWLIVLPAPGISHPDPNLAKALLFIHHYSAWILVGLIGIHFLGAMSHWIIRRDGVYQRMLPRFVQRKKHYYEKENK